MTCLRFEHGKVTTGKVDLHKKEQKWNLGGQACAPGEKH